MLCVKCSEKADNAVTIHHRRKGKALLLTGMLCCLILAGCGSKGSVEDDNVVRGTADSGKPAEEAPAVDEEKEALEAELAEAKAELAKAQEALAESEEKDVEEVKEAEESESVEADELSEEEIEQNNYIIGLRDLADYWAYNRKEYKFTYYADDINHDGFPELLMFGDRNTGLGIEQELYYMFLYYGEYYNKKSERYEWGATYDSSNMWQVFKSNIDTVPESGVLEFSYSDDGSNLVTHTYSSGRRGIIYEVEDNFYIYKDNEVLFNGNKVLDCIDVTADITEMSYITHSADGKHWFDEESYNSFTAPECSKTVRLTARSAWGTVDEALEHLGELP